MATLVVQTSFLGDVVLTTPLIAELAKRSQVDVVTTLPGAQVLANNPAIRNTLVYEKRDGDRGVSGFIRMVSRVRNAGRNAGLPNGSYDAAYLAQGSLRSAMLALAGGVKERIGFDTSAGRALYTQRVRYNAELHHAERLWWLSMSECADPPRPEQVRPRLYPGDDERRAVDRLLTDHGLTEPFIALAPGSAWGTKRWPFYPELATLLHNRFAVVVVGGNADVATGETIVSQLAPGRGLNAAGKLSFLGSAELIARATALVANDSASQHLASAMGTTTVTVYGPTVPEFGFGPRAPGSRTAGVSALACRPCHRHGPPRCPLGHWRCMRELSSREVHEILTNTIS
ncbi:MAG TPA: glycosyltransferase family 9 protein [Gemmatimonadaceae bacterium]|nr:glycosyltransferase family 9 protein [Gemmatimonadaceae bacterium]